MPDNGYEISDVRIDGRSIGATGQYVFIDVRSDHTITASFTELPLIVPNKPDIPDEPDMEKETHQAGGKTEGTEASGKPGTEGNTPEIAEPEDDRFIQQKEEFKETTVSGKTESGQPFILLSAILALLSLLFAVFSLRGRKEETEDETAEADDGKQKRKHRSRIVSFAGAIGAVITFLLTTGWDGIAFMNRWTLLVALFAAISIIIAMKKEGEATSKEEINGE